MSAEAASSAVLALLLLLAGAAASTRPRLGSGHRLSALCWIAGAIASLGAVLAGLFEQPLIATVPVWTACGFVALLGTRPKHPGGRTPHGRSTLGLLSAASIGCASFLVALGAAVTTTGWPERWGVVGNGALVTIAALVIILHTSDRRTIGPAAMQVVVATGVVATTLLLALIIVHLVAGDLRLETASLTESAASAALTGAVALLVTGRLAERAWAAVHRSAPDPTRLLAQLDSVIEQRAPVDEALLRASELVRGSLGAETASVWKVSSNELVLAAADPHQPPRSIALDDTVRRIAGTVSGQTGDRWARTWLPDLVDSVGGVLRLAPVSYAGELQGVVLATGAAIDHDITDELLFEVANRLGPAMHSASLDASLSESVEDLRQREQELRASRERLVAAADTERLRIERDLHDGAQQNLVALGVNLQLARGLIESDPDRAAEILDDLKGLARKATEELRSLSHGIYPQSLEDGGLGPALEEASRQHRSVPITMRIDDLGRLSREVEAAVYFVCNEAITNAVKHAEATRIQVSVVRHGGELTFEVTDDGCGFEVDGATSNQGLTNLADRVGAVNGTLHVGSDSSGTRIVGSVPITSASDENSSR